MKITNFDPDHGSALGTGTGQPAGGDLGGTLPAPSVQGLQGVPVADTAPADGEVLTYVAGDGAWEPLAPGSATPSGPAGGDLGGSYPDPSVAAIAGQPVRAATPVEGHVLSWDAANGWWASAAPAEPAVLEDATIAVLEDGHAAMLEPVFD